MSDPADDLDNEKPLDPATERVRRKLARLMVISIGIMLVGVMAVLGAVVYKSGGLATTGQPATAAIELPDGFTISQTAISQDRIMLLGLSAEKDMRILIYDAVSGNLVADHPVR